MRGGGGGAIEEQLGCYDVLDLDERQPTAGVKGEGGVFNREKKENRKKEGVCVGGGRGEGGAIRVQWYPRYELTIYYNILLEQCDRSLLF